MSFRNGFVVAVIVGGKIVKESSGAVHLPANTEYGIRLRNKNNRRAVGQILIDGEDQGSFVIEAREYVDIYRPAEKDAAFKLVSTESAEAVEFGKNSTAKPNGTLVVKFRLEKENLRVYRPIRRAEPLPYYPPSPDAWWNRTVWSKGVGDLSSRSLRSSLSCDVDNQLIATNSAMSFNSPGVTVEGQRTGQEFGTRRVDLETFETVVTVNMRVTLPFPVGTEVVLEDGSIGVVANPDESLLRVVNFCSDCGLQFGAKAKFCANCGRKR